MTDDDLVLDDGRVVERHHARRPPSELDTATGRIDFEYPEDTKPVRNFGPPTLCPPAKYSDLLPDTQVLGENGEWLVLYGHVDKRIARAAWIAYEARNVGLSHVTAMLNDFGDDAYDLESIGHRWAVEQTDATSTEMAVWWATEADGDITEETPGAFPITFCDTGA